jgi:hypothetical protein
MRRDEQVVEAELIEIMGIQDDIVRLERIVAWCAAYPDEIPFALHFFRKQTGSSKAGDLDAELRESTGLENRG